MGWVSRATRTKPAWRSSRAAPICPSVEALVPPDVHALRRRGQLGEAGMEQIDGALGRVGVAGPEFPGPVIAAQPFEAHQRMIRAAPPLGRVVAAPGLLLVAVDHDHGGVDVEHEPAPTLGRDHAGAQAIVHPAPPGQGPLPQPEQEAPQRRGLRRRAQAGELLDDALVGQEVRGLQALQAEDHRVEERQDHLAYAVAIVALDQAHLGREHLLESEAGEEPMQQVDAAEVCQAVATELQPDIPKPTGHDNQPYFPSRVGCTPHFRAQATCWGVVGSFAVRSRSR